MNWIQYQLYWEIRQKLIFSNLSDEDYILTMLKNHPPIKNKLEEDNLYLGNFTNIKTQQILEKHIRMNFHKYLLMEINKTDPNIDIIKYYINDKDAKVYWCDKHFKNSYDYALKIDNVEILSFILDKINEYREKVVKILLDKTILNIDVINIICVYL